MLNYESDNEKEDNKDNEDDDDGKDDVGMGRQDIDAYSRQYNEVLVGLDANSGLFPMAVYICEKETQSSWEWFLPNLKIHLQYCARHIFANFRLTYKGEYYKKLFWRASRSCNVFDFKEAIKEIGVINPTAKVWLEGIPPSHWSRFAYDHLIMCDHVTNNMTEAFNSMISTHGVASYLELLEFIRRMVVRKFQERKKEFRAWNSIFPPKVNAKILMNSRESRLFIIISAGDMEYELLGGTG
ncbi:hypothetical protein Ddye_012384 [Dipteronia dyeriana]|uniref:Uncharacterized protein n=1 Tax=Dipteronia dyeriana TaxID=168575 RepID=A0AAE0CJ72_9ROSI|nr:hypothetical protein Ddye_012384 [Dipteronia dyeriana]